MKRLRAGSRVALLFALAVQVVLMVVAVGPRLAPRLWGDELRLVVRPLDPIDPLRGAYVDLDYGIPRPGSDLEGTVFVPLRPQGENWRPGRPQDDRPSAGRFLRCDAGEDLDCGIESWFTSPDDARRLERALGRRGLIARVKVDGGGRAAIVGLVPRQ